MKFILSILTICITLTSCTNKLTIDTYYNEFKKVKCCKCNNFHHESGIHLSMVLMQGSEKNIINFLNLKPNNTMFQKHIKHYKLDPNDLTIGFLIFKHSSTSPQFKKNNKVKISIDDKKYITDILYVRNNKEKRLELVPGYHSESFYNIYDDWSYDNSLIGYNTGYYIPPHINQYYIYDRIAIIIIDRKLIKQLAKTQDEASITIETLSSRPFIIKLNEQNIGNIKKCYETMTSDNLKR